MSLSASFEPQSIKANISAPTLSASAPSSVRVPVPGPQGEQGDPGFSPVVSVDEITGGHQVTITDEDGAHTFDVMDGSPGQDGKDGKDGSDGKDGADGVSPTVTVQEITGGHSVSVTDATGTTTFSVMDGATGEQGPQGETGPAGAGVPPVTSSDNGKVLRVVDGAWSAVLLPSASGVSF